MFLNQLYKTPVEKRLDKNPDLLAIRFASTNPILDPWIYILLRKAVLSKVVENIKCLFCRSDSRGQQTQNSLLCINGQQFSSRDSPSGVSRELQDVSSTSQTSLNLAKAPDGGQNSSSESCRCSSHDGQCKKQSLQMSITNDSVQEKSI